VHFLITGHTGFKGTWLAFLLAQMGHEVSGISLEPEEKSLFESTEIHRTLVKDIRRDIRDFERILIDFQEVSPDVVVHFAAQSLVRRGYRHPIETYETNVLGTLNVLEASQLTSNIKAVLIATTDKVYQNDESKRAFRESDTLGGRDPYSSSKDIADLLAQATLRRKTSPRIAIARAGNVIGGGDVGQERLVPDIIKAFSHGTPLALRYPNSVRPWQHVLDCLYGYVSAVQYIITNNISSIWNFGPENKDFVSVKNVAKKLAESWGLHQSIIDDTQIDFEESKFLAIDSNKANIELEWRNLYSTDEAIDLTAQWYKEVNRGNTPNQVTKDQVASFLDQVSKY
jgi:CDP-glucose 4,6-dehydratase